MKRKSGKVMLLNRLAQTANTVGNMGYLRGVFEHFALTEITQRVFLFRLKIMGHIFTKRKLPECSTYDRIFSHCSQKVLQTVVPLPQICYL